MARQDNKRESAEHSSPVERYMDLKALWLDQYKQQQLFQDWSALSDQDRAALRQELLLGLHEEVSELQRLTPRSQSHILKAKPAVSKEDIAEAGVDVLKYLVGLMLLEGVPHTTFETAFDRKTRVVEDKWHSECQQLQGARVLMCDLDECVAGWNEGFRRYLRQCGADKEVTQDLNHPDKEYWKNAFDMSGGYKNLPVISGAQIALAAIRASGIKVVIVTARPYHKHRRIYGDTLEWLAEHSIGHDGIIFTRDKADAVHQLLPATVVGFVEDRAKHAMEVAMAGVQVYKFPSPPNEPIIHHVNITDVTEWSQIAYALLGEDALELYQQELEHVAAAK